MAQGETGVENYTEMKVIRDHIADCLWKLRQRRSICVNINFFREG